MSTVYVNKMVVAKHVRDIRKTLPAFLNVDNDRIKKIDKVKADFELDLMAMGVLSVNSHHIKKILEIIEAGLFMLDWETKCFKSNTQFSKELHMVVTHALNEAKVTGEGLPALTHLLSYHIIDGIYYSASMVEAFILTDSLINKVIREINVSS